MILMLTVTHATDGTREVYRLDTVRVTVGSSQTADVPLQGIAENAALIEPAGARFAVTLSTDTEASSNGEALSGRVIIINGQTLVLGPWQIRFNAVFPQVALHRRTSALPIIAGALVALILLGEIAVGVWLPMAVRSRNQFGLEIARQRTFAVVDHLRQLIAQSKKSEPDPRQEAAMNLIRSEQERITFYLREHESSLDAMQLAQLHEDLLKLKRIAIRINDGTFFPQEPEIDYTTTLDNLLKLEPASP